jgi:antitoxin ChpS
MDTTGPRKVGGSEEPKERPCYTLEKLLSESELPESPSLEDREWVDAPRVGRELI